MYICNFLIFNTKIFFSLKKNEATFPPITRNTNSATGQWQIDLGDEHANQMQTVPRSTQNACHASPSNVWHKKRGNFVQSLGNSSALSFFKPVKEDGFVGSAPPAEVYSEGDEFYNFCLIGQFVGSPPPFFLIRKMVDYHWRMFGKIEIMTAENGFFVFKFENEEYCDRVLEHM